MFGVTQDPSLVLLPQLKEQKTCSRCTIQCNEKTKSQESKCQDNTYLRSDRKRFIKFSESTWVINDSRLLRKSCQNKGMTEKKQLLSRIGLRFFPSSVHLSRTLTLGLWSCIKFRFIRCRRMAIKASR